jgi:hypothetical protein
MGVVMKLKYTFLLLAILLVTSNLFAQNKKLYVFFDDIGVVTNDQGQPITAQGYSGTGTDFIYWEPLLTHNNFFTPNLLKTGYSAFFSSGKKLTDYEVAIFYMGDNPLQWDGGTGRRVVREIKTMLDAGKRVILIGNGLLFWAFDPASTYRDTEVQNFFADYMGIDQNAYLGRINTMASATTYKPFGIKAIQGDPVSYGYKKACNVCQAENSLQALCPWRPRPWIEGINGKRIPDSTEVMEFFTWVYSPEGLNVVSPTDTVIGVHVQRTSADPAQNSKIVFWSTGFEVAAASFYMPNWQEELWYALHWCTTDLPKPGPRLEFNVDPLEFGTVPVDDSLTKEVKITNVGRDPLIIDDMYIEDPYSGFTLQTNELQLTLDPGEYVYVPIKFKPKAEEYFSDYFTVESNAYNGKILSIEVNGYGGKKPEQGPRLAVVSNKLDFGTIGPYDIVTLEVEMTNPGVSPLFIMQSFYWPTVGKRSFQYAENYQWSITIQPKIDTVRRKIKFTPLGKTGTFYDTLGIVPYNAVNYKDDTLWVYLKGISRAGSSDASISLTANELTTDTTNLGEFAYTNFTIQNTGTKKLYIKKLQMEDDFGGVFKIVKNDDDETFPPVIELPIAAGANKKKVLVKFTPKEIKTYIGKVQIEIMDENENPLPDLNASVIVTGIVRDTSTIAVDDTKLNDMISLRAIPNPLNGMSTVYLNLNSNCSDLKVTMVDILGNKVREYHLGAMERGEYSLPVNTAGLSSGMYYITASANGQTVKLSVAVVE